MKQKEKKFLFFLSLTLLYALMIFILSSRSSPPGAETGKSATKYFDIIAHLALYFVFSFLVYMTVIRYPTGIKYNRYVLVFSIVTLYGLIDEVHQTFVPYRFFSLKDLFFDSFASILLFMLIRINGFHRIPLLYRFLEE